MRKIVATANISLDGVTQGPGGVLDRSANVDAGAAERDLLKKYIEASESAHFRAFESIIRADATFPHAARLRRG